MRNDLKDIEVTNIYRLQKDIKFFISRKQKQEKYSWLISLIKSIINIIKSFYNIYTICLFIAFGISSTISLFCLKLLGKLYQESEQGQITSTIFDVLILSTSYAIMFALISIISAPLYYKYILLKELKRKGKKASNLYKYLMPKDNKKANYLTIDGFALKLYQKYDLLELKFQEEELKTNIEEHESSKRIIIPLSIFFIWFSITIFEIITGTSTKSTIDNFDVYFQGISFIVFTTTICNFALNWTLFSSIKFKKQALSAIKKAQILITET